MRRIQSWIWTATKNMEYDIVVEDCGRKSGISSPRKNRTAPISYKNMLLGVNGVDHDYNSDNINMWKDGEGTNEETHTNERETTDRLGPLVTITTEERINLCRPWRNVVIIKLLGRRIGYRFLYGRLAKLWNLFGNFELIDLQNEFFVVRFVEMADYERVMYDESWMILGHYLTVQI